ncbi:MAG: PLP-dependent transferase [Candidatus Thorarchaeota archaeon]|nr:PLP-dependent transferase [Candidatus Thorarchaeota archaeon]
MRKRSLSTRCVQGNRPKHAGPAVEPIVQASTFVFDNQQDLLAAVTGVSNKDVYTRWSNSTTRNVEEKLSALEGTDDSVVLSSGMAAISSTVLGLARKGDRILSCDSIYGGTLHLFEDILPKFGIETDFVSTECLVDAIVDSKSKYRLCFFESPTNPTLRIVDISAVAEGARSSGVISVIDNTFATPINQRPHELGIDVVIHSATKYLGGHSDIIAGSVSASKTQLERIRSTAKLLGGTVDPFASFLLDRGIKTLELRVKRHNSSALYLAEELLKDKRIRRVHYPGLPDHPGHSIARRQMDGFGGILTLDLCCDLRVAEMFVDSLELFLNAVSLGGVESLVSIPVLTTHHGIPNEVLAGMNITESTVRLSVGIEDPVDLLQDIKDSLESAFSV